MNSSDNSVSYDTLSFPLNAAMERLRRQSRFNVLPILLVSGLLSFLTIIFSHPFEAKIMNGAAIFIAVALVYSFMTFNNMRRAKKLLQFYGSAETPILSLDAHGINVPWLLLSDKDRKHLIAAGKTSVEIPWQEIIAWNVWDSSRNPNGFHFRLKTKRGIIVPESNVICIKKDFSQTYSISRSSSNKEEQKLLDFAQRFLAVPIKVGRT